MKNSYQRLLDGVRATLLLPDEWKISPDEVKQVIIFLLSPYFVNQEVFKEAAISYLAPEAVNICRINNDIWAKRMFINVLEEYHKAVETDRDACFAGCVNWHNQILQASSEFVSMLNLNQGLDELSLHDFKYEAFRNIGALIEANLQPYLKELLLQVRIRRGKPDPAQGLETMELGAAVNELYQSSGYAELFAPPPWNIRLNQWRNIAQHHKTRIEKDRIVGTYGIGSNQQEVILTRKELRNVLKRIHSILSLMKGVRSIFYIDHMNEILPVRDEITNVRDDIKIFNFASSIATQGFDLKDVSIDEKSITAIIQDVTELPPDEKLIAYKHKRIIHSSQFIYVLWSYFELDVITIKHLDRDSNLRCIITGKGSDCEAISREEIPFEELAARVVFAF